MNIKKFRAHNMSDALAKVKREFGPDGVILQTRSYNEGAVLGYGGKSVVEITAAKDLASVQTGDTKRRPANPARRNTVAGDRGLTRIPKEESADVMALQRNLTELSGVVGDLLDDARDLGRISVPKSLKRHYHQLIEAQVAEELAAKLVRRVRAECSAAELADEKTVRRKIAAFIASMLPVADSTVQKKGTRPAVIGLVGPTGVGKTTTAAKLAADFSLRKGRSVGLLSLDTQRLGALEQIRAFAEVIGVPLAQAADPQAVSAIMKDFADRDVVIIDANGQNHRDQPGMHALKNLLAAASPTEVHLVLPGTYQTPVLLETIRGYQTLGVDRLLFTKLDEAVGLGVILNCLALADAQLSLTSASPDVSAALQQGEAARISKGIIGDDSPNEAPQPPPQTPKTIGSLKP